uniref:X8 domain-containing protein n=1 Tax=Oryza glaberrima TaxID=4538 RepID=I1QIA9_ORYGL
SSLGYKTSCGGVDTRSNISYRFSSYYITDYYQKNDQDNVACGFSNLATITGRDPGTCRFGIMIEVDSAFSWKLQHVRSSNLLMLLQVLLQLSVILIDARLKRDGCSRASTN